MNNELTTIAEQLRLGNTVIVFTKGVSMKPLLIEGKSHVVIKPLEKPLKKGDLPIVHRNDGKYVIHRVIKVTENGCVTRGDNCYSCEIVSNEKVLGIVTEIYRKNKHFTVKNIIYRIYAALWRTGYPLRYCFMKSKRLIKKIVK